MISRPSAPLRSGRVPLALACLAIAALGAVTTLLDIHLRIEPQEIAVCSMSAGVALAAFLWWPKRDWLPLMGALFAAEAIVIYVSGGPFWLVTAGPCLPL